MKKKLTFKLMISFLLSSLFLSGCNNQNYKDGYIYNIQTNTCLNIDNGRCIIDNQELYLTEDKWKIQHNSNDERLFSKAIDLFDGKNLYMIVKDKNKNLANKDNHRKLNQQQIYISNPAYALLNWDIPCPDNFYTLFDKNIKPKEITSTKSKYGFDCVLYEYNWQKCNYGNCDDVSRKVCVDKTNNMAVSIQLSVMHNKNKDDKSEFNLELIDYKKTKLDNKIFDISSIKNLKIVD